MASAIKGAIEAAIHGTGSARIARFMSRGRAVVLAYHNILPDSADSCGDSSLHLPRAKFAAQLDALLQTHDVVPLEAVLNESSAGRPRVAITFDDAYRGATTIGVEELTRRSLPATIFVAAAFVNDASYWWDALSDPGVGRPPDDLRERALVQLQGKDSEIRRWAEARGYRINEPPEYARVATEEELRASASQPGISLGSHGWSHANLARLTGSELREELEKPLRWLRARFESALPWLSYPYGLSSPVVEEAAASAGYRAALLIEGGFLPRRSARPFALPRMNIPSRLSRIGFVLRTSGLSLR